MSNISKRRKEGSKAKIKSMGDHNEFLKRITKTLYYGQLPSLPCLSLPVTEISCGVWSAGQRGRSLRRLHADAAARLARGACVSPCALVLALLYLERLNACNPDYLASAAPHDLFLVSLMVGNKFLQDDGEDDDVLCSEWAASGGMDLEQLKKLEVEFLNAIEWNVFVNDRSFERGLRWLERRVALKQAGGRGFFTYSDLAAAAGGAGGAGGPLARALAAALALLALAHLAAAAALLAAAAALAAAHAPAPAPAPAPASAPAHAPPAHHLYAPLPDTPVDLNVTGGAAMLTLAEDVASINGFRCCTDWMSYHENVAHRLETRFADASEPDPWWSRTSVLNRLYPSSLVNPVRRWLEIINEYADFVKRHLTNDDRGRLGCIDYMKRNERPHCVRQWLNLSKLNVLVSSASDR